MSLATTNILGPKTKFWERIFRRGSLPITYRYGLAVIYAALGVVMLFWLKPLYTDRAVPLILLALPVAASAWQGGLGPGLLTTLLCALGAWGWLVPPAHFAIPYTGESLRLLIFAITGVIISILAGSAQRANAFLRHSEERYRMLFETMDEGYCAIEVLFDANEKPVDCRFLQINPAFARQTGLENAQGGLFRELIPNLEPFWIETYGRIALTGKPEKFVNNAKTLNRWFQVYAFRIDSPEQHHVAVFFTDISQHIQAMDLLRKKTEELRVNEERFRMLVTGSSEVLYTMSPDWKEMRQLHSRSFLAKTEKPNRSWLQDYIFPEDQPQVLAAINEAIQHKGVFELEHRVRRVDGTPGWTASRAVPLLDDNGEIAEWFGSATDVTDRKKSEEALQLKSAELARSNQELEHFASVVSHDLKEPVRMVQSFGELLEQRHASTLESQVLEYLHYMTDGAKRMTSLIDGLLAYSRVDRGQFTNIKTNMQEVVEGVLSNLKLALNDAKATVDMSPMPVVIGSAPQLAQLFQNLISNALKFHRPGVTPVISICADRQGKDWFFSVTDNGIGIVPEYQERVFELFHRLHTQEEYPGVGIGLAVCKKIVERHGGRIWVESVPGAGSTFFFTLPAAPSP